MRKKNLLRKSINSYKKHFKILGFLLIAGAVLLFLWFIAAKSKLFAIKKIHVLPRELSLVSTEDVARILENRFLGKSFFGREKEFKGVIYTNFPVIKDVRYTISLPNSIAVELQEHKPYAYIKTGFQESYYVSDSDGVVLGARENIEDDLPIIYYDKEMLFLGKKISDKKILTALGILKELKEAGLSVLSCTVNEKISVILRESNTEALFSEGWEEILKEKAILLQKIIQKYSIEGRKIKKIDLRFINPIIDFY